MSVIDDDKLRYDSATQTLRFLADATGDEMFPVEIGKALSKRLRSGNFEGKPLNRVVVEFSDHETAELNADPLAFLGLESEGPDGLVESDASFASRSDIGMD
jgi:hypothetical protein